MKKINPNKDYCNNYKRGNVPHTLTQKTCVSCHYSLFAHCWLEEAKEHGDFIVKRALTGFDREKRMLHNRLKVKERE